MCFCIFCDIRLIFYSYDCSPLCSGVGFCALIRRHHRVFVLSLSFTTMVKPIESVKRWLPDLGYRARVSALLVPRLTYLYHMI